MIPNADRLKEEIRLSKLPERITMVSFWFMDKKPSTFDILNPTKKGSLIVYIEPTDNIRLSNLDFCAGLPIWITYKTKLESLRVNILREKLLELNPKPVTIGYLNNTNFFFENIKTGKRYKNGELQGENHE